MRRAAQLAFVIACALGTPAARAGGLEMDVFGTRGLGRAGAVVVSADGAEALIVNPAGIARRSVPRLQLGAAIIDSDVSYDSPKADSPTISSRASPNIAPLIGFQIVAGPLVVGAAYAELADLSRTLPAPSFDQPAADVERLFPHRYAGLGLRHQRQAIVVGAAVRATDWLGVGVSALGARVDLAEIRHVWAGFDGRDPLGSATRDLRLELAADDPFVPGGSAGALIAPAQIPIELGLSVTYVAAANLSGDAALLSTRSAGFPAPEASMPEATTRLAPMLTLRSGARYLGDWLTVEVAGELTAFTGDAGTPGWQVSGLGVIDESTATAQLTDLDSLVDQRDHAALRAATDVEIVSGFLWLTAGYAYRTSSSARSRLAVGFADLDSHILALGAEGTWEGTTLTLGYARALSSRVQVDASESGVLMVNPFDAGSAPAAAGRYDTASDTFGIAVEVAWE